MAHPMSEPWVNWHPIASAPRDGSRVLLVEEDQPTEVTVGWWLEGAWRDFGDLGCNGQTDYSPTHWAPLPMPLHS